MIVFIILQHYEQKFNKFVEDNANATRICLEAFKYTDMGSYMSGTGKKDTGFTIKEWIYGQSPLATMVGLFCIVFRFLDTRFATFLGYFRKVKLRMYHKVNL